MVCRAGSTPNRPTPSAPCRFYGGLFGWTFAEAVPPGTPGSYVIAKLDGMDVAAIAPGTTPTAEWNTYVAVDDADSVVDGVTRAGGRVVSPPQDAGPGGRGATFTDPTGVEFRVWQARRRLGAQIVNAPAAWNFSDLHTSDAGTARRFYASVFGWEADELDVGGGTATMWRQPGYGDHLAATIDPDIHRRQQAISAPPGFADAIAWLASIDGDEVPHWHVTFAVADRDASVDTATRLGATDVSGPLDTQWTRAAVIRDPQGATMTLSQFKPPTGA